MALFKLKPIFRINYSISNHVPLRFIETARAEQHAPKKFTFNNKIAVITGGADGIGLAIAREFLQQGLTAINVIDIDKEKLNECTKYLKQEFGEEKVVATEADVADTEQMDNAFRNSSVRFGMIDIIVNNAGILDDTNWERQLDTNIKGSVIGTLLGMQYMSKSSSGEGGLIINVGSTMGIVPSCGFPIHSMTQFGIIGFTRALGSSKLYQRTGVNIFGICPGLTNTHAIKNIHDKAINHNFSGEFQDEIKDIPVQTPNSVSKGLVEIMGDAKPGSIWIVENSTSPFELEFPKILEKKKEVKQENEQQSAETNKV